MKHWLFWHQPRSWRHRAFARAAMRLRHDTWGRGLRHWERELAGLRFRFVLPTGIITIPAFKRLR